MSTQFGARGLSGTFGDGVFLSDDPDSWIDHLGRLASKFEIYASAVHGAEVVRQELIKSHNKFELNVLKACEAFDGPGD